MPLYELNLRLGLEELGKLNEEGVMELARKVGKQLGEGKTCEVKCEDNFVNIDIGRARVNVVSVQGLAFDLYGRGEALRIGQEYPIGIISGELFYVGERRGPCVLVVNVPQNIQDIK